MLLTYQITLIVIMLFSSIMALGGKETKMTNNAIALSLASMLAFIVSVLWL